MAVSADLLQKLKQQLAEAGTRLVFAQKVQPNQYKRYTLLSLSRIELLSCWSALLLDCLLTRPEWPFLVCVLLSVLTRGDRQQVLQGKRKIASFCSKEVYLWLCSFQLF